MLGYDSVTVFGGKWTWYNSVITYDGALINRIGFGKEVGRGNGSSTPFALPKFPSVKPAAYS